MNRRERRKLERAGKIPKAEPVYSLKPSQVANTVLDGVGKEALQTEIHNRLVEQERKVSIDIDTSVLWVLHVKYGWGKQRLKTFYNALFEEHRNVRQFYGIDDVYPERMKLKERGIDVEAWYDELFTRDGTYKQDLEEQDGLPVCDN